MGDLCEPVLDGATPEERKIDSAAAELASEPLTPEQQNWANVKNQLASMSQAQADFLNEMREAHRLDVIFIRERFETLESNVGKLFAATDRMADACGTQNDLLSNLNEIVSGVRSASDSNYDMITSAAKKIERVRLFLKVPDEVVNPTIEAEVDEAAAGDSPADPVRR